MASPSASPSSAPLLDQRLLERLERLTLNWQRSFNGLVGGHNLSRFAGAGQEFLDHRSFHQGDDLRSVNWRAYMRFEKLFLKVFQIEPRVPVRLLLDVSKSMDVTNQNNRQSKLDYARRLAAAFVYIGLVRLDSIQLQPFSSRLHDPFLASGGRHRFHTAELFLRTLQPKGQTNFLEVSRQYLNAYRQRGLTIIVSDFLDNGDCFRPLQYLADFGHELLLVQLWNKTDRLPSAAGDWELVDAETGDHIDIGLDSAALEAYTAAFDSFSADLRRLAERNGGRHTGFVTDTSLEEAMFGNAVAGRTAL